MQSTNTTCKMLPVQEALMYLNDIVTVLVGPPLAACLLWHVFTSKRARLDVLNINLALFHTVQYALSASHLVFVLTRPEMPKHLLKFLLVYAQTGGSIRKNAPFLLMLLMMALLCRCSGAVANALRRAGPGGAAPRPAKRRALVTVAATCGVTLLCYIPVASMMHIKLKPGLFSCLVTPLCIGFLSVASVVHPMLYLYTQRRALPVIASWNCCHT